ncbi:MAG: hypothetical protein K8R88_02665 [Armatimonadetes bacterium]|nr:hypothetical protein [Armatimonadota bacterium]
MKLIALFGVTLSLIGCSRPQTDLFPLAVGNEWTYTVKSGLLSRVDVVRVVATDSVAGAPGFRLQGPSGPSRVAWIGNQLVANELSGTRFSPAIPLYSGDGSAKWSGLVTSLGLTTTAKLTLSQELDKFKIGGQELPGSKSTIVLRAGDTQKTLTFLFIKGLGLVRQEESDGTTMTRSVVYVKGP